MRLHDPILITARLLPGVKIGDAYVSITFGREKNRRAQYLSYIDLPDGRTFTIDDHYSRVGGGTLQDGLSSLLCFLSSAVESYASGEPVELFDADLVEWAAQYADDISLLQLTLDETPDLITE